ncbi:toprim domain-containing protein [Dyadobacter sp. MSC1_007]|jgi:SOS response regulatory protein OraA/RecX|uniref:toprim domain-containing protein n=1 Tax=Dyadobacter sp. MSC1_007 TaxID=2909264 RepID=UPI0020301A5C|nr:toprim domain-containing protein [Dyadobacter sp. MSC1_007]
MERANYQVDSDFFEQNGTSGTRGKWNGTERRRVKKRKVMNAKQINQTYEIVAFLARHGFRPTSVKGDNYWYISMIRGPESRASFKVDSRKNLWYDHALGVGGNVVDLACRLFQNSDVKEVMRLITDGLSSFHPQQTEVRLQPDVSSGLRIISEGILENDYLLRYLRRRGISEEVARSYCFQVSYENNGREYNAIGFRNRAGGIELRSMNFKSCIAPKDVSYIDNSGNKLLVFEGFMDFFSYWMLPVFQISDANFLILNSTSQLKRAHEFLAAPGPKYLFLDNDKAGFETAAYMKHNNPNVIDLAVMYAGCKDLNDFLTQNQHLNDQRLAVALVREKGPEAPENALRAF